MGNKDGYQLDRLVVPPFRKYHIEFHAAMIRQNRCFVTETDRFVFYRHLGDSYFTKCFRDNIFDKTFAICITIKFTFEKKNTIKSKLFTSRFLPFWARLIAAVKQTPSDSSCLTGMYHFSTRTLSNNICNLSVGKTSFSI